MPDPGKQRHRVVVQGLAPVRKPGAAEAPVSAAPTATAPFRIGHGYDIHKLQPGGKMLLGGVLVSDQISPIAHSDGDVVIHALVDALLGAMGWGDIGQLFSDADPQWKGHPSRHFLQTVSDRAREAGMRAVNVDVTILAEQPRIAPFKAQMIQILREILGASCVVNIKAGTNEGCDAIGRGEAIAAHAVVLLASEPS
jgi:2-C-methyl-D-erythritol 2,4-cyclodiphosphate synthase